MLLGYKDYIVSGEDFKRLYGQIIDTRLPVRKMYEDKDRLFVRISAELSRYFENLCRELGYDFKLEKTTGLCHAFGFLKHRPGIIAGFVFTLAVLTYLSNIVLRFEVLSDDQNIKNKVIHSLESQGITAGSYIPSINYIVTERTLRKDIEEISWAGITRQGNCLLIDVLENVETPEFAERRLPTNLIACENGVIDKIIVDDGQIKIGVGSGVTKGEIIVGGEIITSKSQWVDGKEQVDTSVSYVRSIGKVYGTFYRTVTFEQPFSDTKKTDTGKTDEVKYLSLFSADIPLFLSMPEGYFKCESSKNSLEFMGVTLPISVTSCQLTEYDYKAYEYSTEEAEQILNSKIYNYEKNFLSDFEIKDKSVTSEISDSGVKRTVSYTLYGVMSKESSFFIPKQNFN